MDLLLNGAKILMFEGVPTYPTPSRFWQIIDKHKVNIFYTAPTAIRSLMQQGDKFIENFDLSSLKTLGSVGEPINLEAWNWYNEKVGKNKCQIVDTWWQTETGGIVISNLSHITKAKACFATKPLPGIEAVLLDSEGNEIFESNQEGNICIKSPWPSVLQGVWGDKKRFIETYFETYPSYYLAGDAAFKDEDGDYRIIGRIDDVINVSGHRLGSAEIENAVNLHPNISESAAIATPHNIKGEAIYVFAINKNEITPETHTEIKQLISQEIGKIALPEKIFIVKDLPKTRSGKIMRRILKNIINKEEKFGDITTLVNPEIISFIKKEIL